MGGAVIALVLGLAAAQVADLDAPEEAPFAPSANRITGFDGASGMDLSESGVVGGDGGTWMTTVGVRVRHDDLRVGLRLPFATWSGPDGRETDLGNASIEGWYALPALPGVEGLEHAVGLVASFNPGGHPWTWSNRPEELWPGGGVDAVWELRTLAPTGTLVLGRGAFGVHGTRGYEPVPGAWVRLQAAIAADQTVAPGVGLVGEAAVGYWDLSPFELSGFVRGDPTAGLRVRGGVVLPAFTWFGWDPVGRPAGIREATLRLEVSTAL